MSEKWTLAEVFDAYPGGIKVPRIQRGYVQGRNDAKGEAIRAEFGPALVDAVFGGKELSLDFVYGVASEDGEGRRVLMPLDGQQRLTTLLLLAWLCGKWIRTWRFDYETRRIPQLFAEGLREHRRQGPEAPSAEIKASAWFLPVWKNDPSVAGMLEMLDALDKEIGGRDRTTADFSRVTFLLHGIDGNSATFDHVFRKMNARGKELSPWENLKAILDKYVPSDDWRNKIDGDWSETTWHHTGEAIVKLDNALEKVVRMAYARFAGSDAQDEPLWQIDERLGGKSNAERGTVGFSLKTRELFYQMVATYFGMLETVAGHWTKDRTQNTLWKGAEGKDGGGVLDTQTANGGKADGKADFWNWLSDGKFASQENLLRFIYLCEPSALPDGNRRRRVLLNLLDNTTVDKNTDKLLQTGLKFLSGDDRSCLADFHHEQFEDENWKWQDCFDENEIVKIERKPLVWRGSTAFLGKRHPKVMLDALSKLEDAVKTDKKNLFLGLLALCGKCDNGLPCGRIRIPETDEHWAEECFSVKRLFLREGVDAWLKGKRYESASCASDWVNHISALWNTAKNHGLKRIATKDAGWLFCILNQNLTPHTIAIRLVRSLKERERLDWLADVQRTEAGVPYITWQVLPYNGFMKAKEGDWYYNVKEPSWWNAENPQKWVKVEDGKFIKWENQGD